MTMARSMHLFFAAVLLMALAVSGCAPGLPTRDRVAPPPARPGEEDRAPLPAIEPVRVEERVRELEAFLGEDRPLSEDERREAQALLDGYGRVLQALRSPDTRDQGQVPAVLFDRLGSLEERFLETAREAPGPVEPVASLLSRKRKAIRDAYLSGDYRAVVRACTDLEDTYGADALTPETGLLFALALAETGKTREAIRVGDRILPELEGRPGLVELRSRMVSWHREAGNPEQARALHEKLVDDVMAQRRLLEQAEQAAAPTAFVPRPAEPPPGPTPRAPEKAAPQGPLQDLLHRVDALLRDKSYDQARLLLIRQRIRYSEGSEIEVIDRALERVDRAEAEDPARRSTSLHASPQEADRGIEEVRRRMEAEDFEGVLDELDRMEETGVEARPEITTLREQAAFRFIQEKRESAAKLFLRARNTQDRQEKASYLRTSRRILKELLERFPGASLAPKIRSNLETVEQEMKRLGISPGDGGRLE